MRLLYILFISAFFNNIYAQKKIIQQIHFGDTIKNKKYHHGDNIVLYTDADFQEATFLNEVNFHQTFFEGNAIFCNDTFLNNAYFEYSTFTNIALFNDSKFNEKANYSYAEFNDFTAFYQAAFLNDAVFIYGKFKKEVDFFKAGFFNRALFARTYFSEKANFIKTSFEDIVDFSYSTHKGHAYFQNTCFLKSVNFTGTRFYKTPKFNNLITQSTTIFIFDSTVFYDSIDFSYNPNLQCKIDLTPLSFNYDKKTGKPKCIYINLHKSDISKFHLDYNHFKLYFLTNVPIDEQKSTYEALLKNFKDRGQMDSYQILDIEYKKFTDNSDNKWQSKLNEWWWNFGYSKEYIFRHSLFFIILFSFLTFYFVNYLNQYAYKIVNFPNTVYAFHRTKWMYNIFIFIRQFLSPISNYTKSKGAIRIIIILALFAFILSNYNFYINNEVHINPLSMFFIGILKVIICVEQYIFVFFNIIIYPLLFIVVINNSNKFSKYIWVKSLDSIFSDWVIRFWYSFVYTANLFFPIFLKNEGLQYKSIWGTAYVFIVYVIGLLCMGYIANFILQK